MKSKKIYYFRARMSAVSPTLCLINVFKYFTSDNFMPH